MDSGEAAKYYGQQGPPAPPPNSYQMQPMQNNGYNYTQPYQGQYGDGYANNGYGNGQYQGQPPPPQPPKPEPAPNGNYDGPPPSYDEVFKIQKPKYNDLWAGILFLLTCAGFVAVSGMSIQGYGTLLLRYSRLSVVC